MSSTRIAVLGSNSFSGSDFIDYLLDLGTYDVLALSRAPEKPAVFLPYLRHGHGRVRFHQTDLNHDMATICLELDAFEPRYIVNFAAQSEVAPSWAHPDDWFRTNTVALAQLVNHLKDRPYLERYLHVSSPEVYGACTGTVLESAPLDPSTPYAASKAAADLLLYAYRKSLDFPLVLVRSTNVYGAHQQLFKIIPRSVIRLRRGETIELHGGGTAVKSYIHIRDVSRGELAILERGTVGDIYHLSPDRGYAVRDVVRTICDQLGVAFETSTIAVAERLGQDAAYVIDSSKARAQFGWRAEIDLPAGVRGVIDWVDGHWDAIERTPHEYIHAA
jgi:dTDP-glucose 4,6-dehydratase